MPYRVQFHDRHFRLVDPDGAAPRVDILPVSGEVHYWRNICEYWPRILDNVQDALGLSYLQSYVSWEYHETAPNEYDFTGQTAPNRDLDGFLTMCEDRGLWVGIRPGPWIYSELDWGGLPERWGTRSPLARLDPEFLVEAEQWVTGVARALVPHLVTRGGCVICCQVDNEVSGLKGEWAVVGGAPDQFGTFAYFMKHVHWQGDLAAANRAYGTAWADWTDAEPMVSPRTPPEVVQFRDSARFFEWVQTAYVNKVAGWYKAAGIDVPLYVNTTGQPFPLDPARLGIDSPETTTRNAGVGVDLIGADHYPLPLEIDPAHAEVKEVGKSGGFAYYDLLGIVFNGHYGAAVSPVNWIAEFRSGGYMAQLWESASARWQDPSYYRYYALVALLGNFAGWNWYMLVDRDRFHCAPMATDGRLWPHIGKVFGALVRGLHAADWPRFQPKDPVGLYWDRTQALTYARTTPFDPEFSLAQTNPLTVAVKNLFFGSASWTLVDSRHPPTPARTPCLIYAGWDDLGLVQTRQLRDYVEAGGLLVFQGPIPARDLTEDGEQPNDVFADLPRPTGYLRVAGNYSVTIPVLAGETTGSPRSPRSPLAVSLGPSPALATYPKPPGVQPLRAHGMTVGYLKALGKGHVAVPGFDLHEGILSRVLAHWGVPRHVEIRGNKVIGAAFGDGPDLAVPYLNFGSSVETTTFRFPTLDPAGSYRVARHFDATSEVVPGEDLRALRLEVKPKSGDLLTVSPE